jgi:hypothetical protein
VFMPVEVTLSNTERMVEVVATVRGLLDEVSSVSSWSVVGDDVLVSRGLVDVTDLLCSALTARFGSDGSYVDERFRDVSGWLAFRAGWGGPKADRVSGPLGYSMICHCSGWRPVRVRSRIPMWLRLALR